MFSHFESERTSAGTIKRSGASAGQALKPLRGTPAVSTVALPSQDDRAGLGGGVAEACARLAGSATGSGLPTKLVSLRRGRTPLDSAGAAPMIDPARRGRHQA
jgi:hypothetical protein